MLSVLTSRATEMRLLWLVLLIPLFGFTTCTKKEYVEVPGEVRYRDRPVVQPISPDLLVERPIAEGPPSQCPNVAAERRRELEICNGFLRKIKERQE